MFLNYINAFRAFAIIFIVAIHTIHIFHWQEQFATEKALWILLGNGTVFFVFISGYLFQHLSAKFKAIKYYRSKISNVLLPYLIVSIPALLYFLVFPHEVKLFPNFYENPLWLQIIYTYTHALHLYPYWFIPMIMLFYLAAPVLLWADKRNIFYWLLPLLILFSCLADRSTILSSFIHFFSIYVMGMFCSKYKAQVNELLSYNSIRLFLLLGYTTLFLFEFFAVVPDFKPINFVQKIFLLFLMLSLFIKYDQYLNNIYVNTLANVSFGIFFLHAYVLFVLRLISINTGKYVLQNEHAMITGNFMIFATTVILILLICTYFTFLIRKMLGAKSHLLIGYLKPGKLSVA
ncbi:MAG: acyltransferase [Pseudomonadota bacterium]